MKKTAESVSLGHPDKISDFISSFVLDKLVARDAFVKYAVEVMIKDNTIVFGGEVATYVDFAPHLTKWACEALEQIGYTNQYSDIWGDFAVNIGKINVINLIGVQSPDISRGVVNQSGWGDQGVFVGYACQGPGNISRELYLSRKINSALYRLARDNAQMRLGLDIKTQVTLNDDDTVDTVIVAIPMLDNHDLSGFISDVVGEPVARLIVNGTGRYTYHSSVADCGITGRKLACDFYSTASPIGGGSPWTKDASKADLSLNLYARKLALENLGDNDECWVYLSSCIGQAELPSATVKVRQGNHWHRHNLVIDKQPFEIIAELGLNAPVFADLCRKSVGIY